MNTPLCCWKCGADLSSLLLPLSRRDECPACHADLHVCRMCEFYKTSVAKACREPVADEVHDKTRANFCGYFQPNPLVYPSASAIGQGSARAGLEALFGGNVASPGTPDEARARLDDLFKSR